MQRNAKLGVVIAHVESNVEVSHPAIQQAEVSVSRHTVIVTEQTPHTIVSFIELQ